MDPALLWAITGLVLVIVELLTGTFYLLMLGIAAFGAAATAWLGYDFPAQAIVVAAITQLAQTTLRSEIGKMELDKTRQAQAAAKA